MVSVRGEGGFCTKASRRGRGSGGFVRKVRGFYAVFDRPRTEGAGFKSKGEDGHDAMGGESDSSDISDISESRTEGGRGLGVVLDRARGQMKRSGAEGSRGVPDDPEGRLRG